MPSCMQRQLHIPKRLTLIEKMHRPWVVVRFLPLVWLKSERNEAIGHNKGVVLLMVHESGIGTRVRYQKSEGAWMRASMVSQSGKTKLLM